MSRYPSLQVNFTSSGIQIIKRDSFILEVACKDKEIVKVFNKNGTELTPSVQVSSSKGISDIRADSNDKNTKNIWVRVFTREVRDAVKEKI